MVLKTAILTILILSLNACILYPLKEGVSYLKKKANECNEVQDIYYYPDKTYNPDYFAIIQRCPYTLNILNKELPTFYIKRRFYDDYAKEYTDLGLMFPYPRRTGQEGVILNIYK